MLQIPLQAIENQTSFLQLNGQDVQLNVYQKSTGVFMDIYVSGTVVLAGCMCRNQTLCVMNAYLGFLGDFMWIDTTGGNADPIYTGIGSRFLLIYLLPSDIPATAIF